MDRPRSAFGAAPSKATTPVDRRSRIRGVCLVTLWSACVALPAHAGLFDDEEARKAIVDLRTRITQSDDSSKARTAELSATGPNVAAEMPNEKQRLRACACPAGSAKINAARASGAARVTSTLP